MISRGEFRSVLILFMFGLIADVIPAAPSSADNDQLKRAFRQFPTADLNDDGTLTQTELRTFHRERAQRMRANRKPQVFTTVFRPTAEDLHVATKLAREYPHSTLAAKKGNGLRVLMLGHSWVAPAQKTLNGIAHAAGFDGHRQRERLKGGARGSANALWLNEFGKLPGEKAYPSQLPAIATGSWDVLTFGSYYEDKPEYFGQWIDVCLKYNPAMTFFIQDGWPRVNSSYLRMKPDIAVKKLDTEMKRMEKEYFTPGFGALNKMYPGRVHFIPSGSAVVELIRRYYAKQVPAFDCLSENFGGKCGIYRDGSHLSKTSGVEHLIGYVYYATLYHRSPTLIEKPTPDIEAQLDTQLREIAWRAVIESPLSGVKDQDADGMAD